MERANRSTENTTNGKTHTKDTNGKRIFSDGLYLIYSYLRLNDIVYAARSCHFWYRAAQLVRPGSTDLIDFPSNQLSECLQSPLRHHIRSLRTSNSLSLRADIDGHPVDGIPPSEHHSPNSRFHLSTLEKILSLMPMLEILECEIIPALSLEDEFEYIATDEESYPVYPIQFDQKSHLAKFEVRTSGPIGNGNNARLDTSVHAILRVSQFAWHKMRDLTLGSLDVAHIDIICSRFPSLTRLHIHTLLYSSMAPDGAFNCLAQLKDLHQLTFQQCPWQDFSRLFSLTMPELKHLTYHLSWWSSTDDMDSYNKFLHCLVRIFPSLTRLDGISLDTTIQSLSILSGLSDLAYLDLRLNDEQLSSIRDLEPELERFTNLTHLQIHSTPNDDWSMVCWAIPNLTSITFNCPRAGVRISSMDLSKIPMKQIRSLRMTHGVQWNEETIHTISGNFPSLTHLHLSSKPNPLPSRNDVLVTFEMMRENLPQLEHIIVEGTRTEDQRVEWKLNEVTKREHETCTQEEVEQQTESECNKRSRSESSSSCSSH